MVGSYDVKQQAGGNDPSIHPFLIFEFAFLADAHRASVAATVTFDTARKLQIPVGR
jgi:hypothetical protein